MSVMLTPLKKWEDLPEFMQTDAVRPYYDSLARKKVSLVFKRIFDIVMSAVMLIILLLPMAVIAVIIAADSKGGVFFRQERVTQYGKKFRIHKFRTMVANAEALGSQVTVSNDMRVTKVGGFLRKYRLDELPQILDILTGNMSFVGTRPETTKYVQRYTPEMYATLLLPAGVTSEASIMYKDENTLLEAAEDVDDVYVNRVLPEKMKYNLESIMKFSFWGDIGVCFKTVSAVFKRD